MEIKDIVNRDIVNLTNCEQEPIHIPGSIQPHGFLIGLQAGNMIIDFCSGNLSAFINLTHEQVLGKHFHAAFGEENENILVKYITELKTASSTFPLILTISEKQYLFIIHKSDDTYILEGEPAAFTQNNLPNTYEQTRQFLSYMEQTTTLQQLCDSVVRETRNITGYDRVMIYRFDDQYNGEIFAESKRDDLEPFLGLHYPHTDIPAQARELYMKNLLRLIADINYEPVPIYTIDNRQNKNLDLGNSVLRSTSPIHVQYLQNMGVGATLTISLIHKNRLWGLIACHHYSAKNLSYPSRIAAQLQGHFLTSQIDIRQSNEEYHTSRKANAALEKCLSVTFENKQRSFNEICSNKLLLDICNATGVCIMVNDIMYKGGKTPGDSDITSIVHQLPAEAKLNGFHTSHLSHHLPHTAIICDTAAGIIFHSLSIANDDCIIWFKAETITEVNWAGDPNKAIVKDEKGLHPRNSFRLWKEVIKCKSSPWIQPELNAAANYAHALQKHVTLLELSEEEEKYRRLTEILKENNDELENINWISTHDLQEPLRKIQLIASRILAADEHSLAEHTKNEMITRMNNAASRMQVLLKDILNYTKIKNAEEKLTVLNLNEVVNEVLADLDETVKEYKAKVVIEPLPAIKGVYFLVKQLFTNLITNSLKFTAADKPQVITINYLPDFEGSQYHRLFVSDRGIGFEQVFAEDIFKIFRRLHTQSEYQGSGIGLALCKKVMQAHKGYITAKGKPGEGAEFTLFFPM